MSILNDEKALQQLVEEIESQKTPPLHLWDPPETGHSKMVIYRNGDWWHDGGQVKRLALAKLFSTVMRREGDKYFLVTPVEKQEVTVEDSPFVITEMEQLAAGDAAAAHLAFTTNLGDKVLLSKDNPLMLETNDQGDEVPYVLVREGLWARLDTNIYYQCVALVEERQEEGQVSWWLNSGDYSVKLGQQA